MISVSDFARENPDEELVERVKAFAERQRAKASGAPREASSSVANAGKTSSKETAKKSAGRKASAKKAANKKASARKKPARGGVSEEKREKVRQVAALLRAEAESKAEAEVALPPPAIASEPLPVSAKVAPVSKPVKAEVAAPKPVIAEPEAPKTVATKPEPPKPPVLEPAVETGADVFIPVDIGERGEMEEVEFVTDGTFATAEHEVFLLEEGGESDETSGSAPTPSHFREDDSEQDFLSVGPDLGDMTSSEYDASMVELAPIVVPPYEGGAAEIARIPLGGRTVLIVKVVRRGGQPQIQLVEELESLVAGAVGRLLLTLPGEDVEDLLGAMIQVKRVIHESFRPDEEGEGEDLFLH
jgi:hypothetical protein